MTFKLNEILTTNEALELLDRENRVDLYGKGRLADKYEIKTGSIGRSRWFDMEDVKEVARTLARETVRGKPYDEEQQEQNMEAYYGRLRKVRTEIAKIPRRDMHRDKFYLQEEALELLGDISPQALYERSDFNGGTLSTVLFSRTHMWLKSDIDAAAGNKSEE